MATAGVLLLGVQQTPAASTPPAQHATADSTGDRLRRELTPWLEEQARSGDFSGVVFVARNGTPIYSVAYGQADRSRGVANTIDTRFNLGSMNKMWTAVAVAQLVERGKLDLDAPVGRYLPDLPNAAVREQVKLRHLLSHTSGLGSYFKRGFAANGTYVTKMSDYLPFFIDDSLSFTPGARMQYSNAGFALLGLIIERVSGASYYDYMQQNVFDRAGMTRAAFEDLRSRPSTIARGYTKPRGESAAAENWDGIESRSSPAGGAYASAPDLVAFSRALWSGKLASQSLVATFTQGVVPMGPTIKYALGFGVGEMGGWRHVGHNGGAPGVSAEFIAFPDQGIDIVVLANIDSPAASRALSRVLRIVTGVGGAAVEPQRVVRP